MAAPRRDRSDRTGCGGAVGRRSLAQRGSEECGTPMNTASSRALRLTSDYTQQLTTHSDLPMRAILLSICFFVPVLTYLVTGLAKLAIVFDADPFLSEPNPVFSFLSNHTVIAVAAGLEVCAVIAAVCLRRHWLRHSFIVLLWMALVLASYRAFLDLTAVNSSCRCLGVLETMLHPGGGTTVFLRTWLALLVLLSATGILLTRPPVTSAAQSGGFDVPRSAILPLVAVLMICSAKKSHGAGPPGDGGSELGNGFTARGHLEVNWYGPTNTVSHIQRYAFETAVSLDHWRISVILTNGVTEHYHGDGTMVLQWLADSASSAPAFPATISPSSYPTEGYPASVIWLALASARHLAQKQPLPHPTASAYLSPQAFMIAADVVVNDDAPGLPARVVFRVDSTLRSAAARNPLLKIEGIGGKDIASRRRALAALPSGLIRATYQVATWKSLGAMRIPGTADLEVFAKDSTNRIISRFHISVDSLERCTEEVDWPVCGIPWSISDRRFRVEHRGIECIQYMTNSVPLSVGDERLQQLFTARKAKAPLVTTDAIIEPLVWVAFGLLLVAPLCLLRTHFASRRRDRQQDNTTQESKRKI